MSKNGKNENNNILNNKNHDTITKRGRKKQVIPNIIETDIQNIMIEEEIKDPVKKNITINTDNKTNIKKNKSSLTKEQFDIKQILNNNISDNKKNISDIKNDNLDIKNDTSDENNNNNFLKEMLTKQIKTVNSSKKLSYNDIKRISKFLNISIFDEDQCSLWTGYITNEKNQSKGTYINFYFNKKKIALHRLLFLNYIGEISNEEYIKFSCENKGKCCNINHMKKYSYNKKTKEDIPEKNENEQAPKTDSKLHINIDKKKLIIEF